MEATQNFLNVMNQMTFFQMTLFYLSLFIVYIGIAMFIIGKTWSMKEREIYNPVFTGFLDAMGLIFAIIVGTVIVAVWQASEKAMGITVSEASAVGDLYRLATDLPRAEAQRVRDLLIRYMDDVIHVEWPAMNKGMRTDSGWVYLEDIQALLVTSEKTHPLLTVKLQTYLGQIYDYRRQRVNSSNSNVNYLIYILIFVISAFIVLFCTMSGVPTRWAHFALCVFLAVLMSLTISTIVALDWPYQTQIRIPPTEMLRVREAVLKIKS